MIRETRTKAAVNDGFKRTSDRKDKNQTGTLYFSINGIAYSKNKIECDVIEDKFQNLPAGYKLEDIIVQ